MKSTIMLYAFMHTLSYIHDLRIIKTLLKDWRVDIAYNHPINFV